ncbi:MAG: adenosine kinase [Bacteroidales bacterium]|nr:adenosine kinase [Bacteroidales bacterium]
MGKVLAIGNALVDILFKLENDNLLQTFNLAKGSMQLVDKNQSDIIISQTGSLEKTMVSGGSAANTINSLAALGANSAYIGKIGKDEFGAFFKSDMLNNGVKPMLLESETITGRAVALISKDSERTFATYLGAAVELQSSDLTLDMFKTYNYVHLEGYLAFNQELIEHALKLAKEAGCKISIDMASFNVIEAMPDFMKRIVKQYVDIVFLNEEEAKSFTGKEPREAVDEVAEVCEIAVVKVGKNGSYIKKGNEFYQVPAIKATALDTTGAGDNYAAGFLYGLLNNQPLPVCGAIGSLLGGKVIEVIGAKLPQQTWDKIKSEISSIVK